MINKENLKNYFYFYWNYLNFECIFEMSAQLVRFAKYHTYNTCTLR